MKKPRSSAATVEDWKRQHAAAHDRISLLVTRAFGAVRPVIRARGRQPVEHIGCGVLLKVNAQLFLLTAAHVLDEFDRETLFVASDSRRLVPALGIARRSNPPLGLGREDDLIDAAVLAIDAAHWPADAGFEPFTTEDVDVREWMTPTANCLLYGYPESKVRVSLPSATVRGETLKMLASRASADVMRKIGVVPESHVVFDLDPSSSMSETGLRAAPHPAGMSGGGVFSLPELDEPQLIRRGKLIGVFTEFRRASKIGLATRIAYHFELIRTGWPDLSQWLPSHGRLPIKMRSADANDSRTL